MSVYYNDNDAYATRWLRNLIAAGHLPEGDVDERSIEEVSADDVRSYSQAHFFAGIGGWPLALAMAGWSGPVWTGSCPCQPFSVAGLGAGSADPRHLWPAWMRLIRECRPDAILGEQVPGAVGHGWLDLVSGDLEAEDYAVGSVVLGAHSAGAPHIRQRLWWVADATSGEAHAATAGRLHPQSASGGTDGRVADAAHPDGRPGTGRGNGSAAGDGGKLRDSTTATNRRSAWAGQGLIPCADGKARPTQPGIHPLAHGVPGRVGQLRAYGNAIVPQVGAAFVRAFGIARSLPPALD